VKACATQLSHRRPSITVAGRSCAACSESAPFPITPWLSAGNPPTNPATSIMSGRTADETSPTGRHVVFLFAACMSNRLFAQQTPPSILDLQTRALAAMDDNDKKHRDVLYSRRIWAEWSGKERCSFICLDEPKAITWKSPVVEAHTELVEGKFALVMDQWSDGISTKPLFEMSPRKRTLGSGYFFFTDYMVRELLGPRRRLRFAGQESLQVLPVYKIESTPDPTVRSVSKEFFAKCATGIKASVYLDAGNFYPVRVVTEVQSTAEGCGVVMNYAVGAVFQWDYAQVAGKDNCGELHSIYVPKETIFWGRADKQVPAGGLFGGTPNLTWTFLNGSVAERIFSLDAGFANGTVTAFAISDKFRVFVTGACMVTAPIEVVESTVRFGDEVPKPQ
jgi:hypothetical protein